jgi:hypothetical protein
LSNISADDGGLRHEPEAQVQPAGEMSAVALRQIHPRHGSQLDRQGLTSPRSTQPAAGLDVDAASTHLQVDGHHVRHEHHEQQPVLELGAGRDGRLVVVRVDVGHTDDGTGAREVEELDNGGGSFCQAPAGEEMAQAVQASGSRGAIVLHCHRW